MPNLAPTVDAEFLNHPFCAKLLSQPMEGVTNTNFAIPAKDGYCSCPYWPGWSIATRGYSDRLAAFAHKFYRGIVVILVAFAALANHDNVNVTEMPAGLYSGASVNDVGTSAISVEQPCFTTVMSIA